METIEDLRSLHCEIKDILSDDHEDIKRENRQELLDTMRSIRRQLGWSAVESEVSIADTELSNDCNNKLSSRNEGNL